jgi:hypothetical protein
MNISDISKSDLYSLVTGHNMAFIQADIHKAQSLAPDELKRISEKSIDTTDFMSIWKSGLDPAGDLNSDEAVAKKIADVGNRINSAYQSGKLSDADYGTLMQGFEQYKIDYPNSVEEDRARMIVHNEIGKAYFGNPYARVGVNIFDVENDRVQSMMSQSDKPWAIDREKLNQMVNTMMNTVYDSGITPTSVTAKGNL